MTQAVPAPAPGTAPAAASPARRQPVRGLPDPGEQVPLLAWPTVALYVGTLALFVLEAWAVLVAEWSPWLTVPMGTAVTFLMFSVLHEAVHHAVSTDTRVNDTFGRLAQPFVTAYATYTLFRFIHIEHHRNTNEAKDTDPDAWTSEGPWWQLPFRWATIDLWYFWFWLHRLGERPRAEVVSQTVVGLGVVAGFVALAVTGYGTELLVLYLVPQRLGLVVLAWWFDYLPHHGLTATQREDKYQATRVRVGGERWLTPLMVYQNYHLVHHLHPSVPFYRYLRAWRRNEQAYLDRNAAISTWFGRSLTPAEYRTWRRLTDDLESTVGPPAGGGARPVFHPLRVRSVEQVVADCVTVTFDVPADLAADYRYEHGQHLTLRAIVDGREVRRSYSIVEPVSAETLRVAVKRIDGGVFSGYVHEQLRAGDVLDVMTPAGRFRTPLDPGTERRYVAIAAGSGITPVLSIVATTLEVEPRSTVTLVYGNRTTASTMFAPELDALQARYADRLRVHHVLSQEPDAALTGRIDEELVTRVVEDPSAVDTWFLCGPQGLVEGLRETLSTRHPGTPVLTELFHTGTTDGGSGAADQVDLESSVTVTLDGARTTFPLRSGGEAVLDAALRAGIDPPYSCAGGACGTCRAKVVLGRAVMDQNHALAEAEVADGYVLTCQAHPVSEQLGVDYDA